MEDILKAKLGCRIGGVNYADDIILLSGSVVKMQSVLDMSMNFGLNNDIKFNPEKSGFFITNVHSVINLKLGQNDLCKLKKLSY